VEVREQYQIKIFNRFVPLGNLDGNVDIKRAFEVLEKIKKASAKECCHYSDFSHGLTKSAENY
jgi:hypothetical protein